ncbi:glutamine--tRNA ligase/YqeY domain fusion protein [Deinococcus multiflagellatus]|uniref:glutamine--tRNA ligase/YqeY domain fusion protein n=1 Tax=Deinococcus multiflagellatus TaxID=1656887 RepID=UPI001CCCE7EB|nr:glutamine--tRNA ligase/YqeY domain fusion protein [Deinococcus multiflagellatus]MBZ9713468.1 glutamine--tRNA ligase/YqeY domain fusion protein [Deinococcus multiflagellatus]
MTAPESPAASSPGAPRVAPNFITEIIERDLKAGKYPQVVTRFPPEPSGYAHLGHIFASFLDFQTAVQYGGRYHLRMDDTNPELATQEYADAIAEDLQWLGWDWGEHLYYASDYFERYYAYAEQLVLQGDAYVDSVSGAEMARLRGDPHTPGTPSPYRSRTPEENLDLLRRMRAGEFADGEHVLRAKIDLGSPNMKLRDPVLYRILRGHHYRAGDAWCIYPMYDFQHPLQDAIEGVTHSMCSLEFVDNRAIYDWLMERLGFEPRPHQYEFGRRGLEYTITSKRKLRKLVEEGAVSGWDDPRMPTLRGQRRLGVTPEAIRAFAAQIGVSRTNRTVDISVYENAVRDDLNHRAPRVMAVLNPVRLTLSNLGTTQILQLPYWPFDVVRDSPDGLVARPTGERVAPEQATRPVPLTRELYIERDDFHPEPPKGYKRLTPGGTVRLRGAGIIRADRFEVDEEGQVTHIHATLLGEDAKAGGVIHWVSAERALPAEFRLYDRLFRVPNPEAANPKDTAAGPENPPFDPEGIGHEDESAPLDAKFLRYLNPESLRVTRGFVEPSVEHDPADTRYQFERQGYFWRDPVDSRPGTLVFGRIITLKDTWAGKAEGGKPAAEGQSKNAQGSRGQGVEKQVGGEKPASPAAAPAPLTPEQEAEAARLTGLGAAEAEARTAARDEALLAFVQGAVPGATFGQVVSWAVNDLAPGLRAGTVQVQAADLAPLAERLAAGELTTRVAREVLARAAASGEAPLGIIERENLGGALSAEALAAAVAEVLAAHPDKVAAYRAGKTALMGFFTGQAMRVTGGKAQPQALAQALQRALAPQDA